MQSIYNSLILPYFHYCNIVWENTAKYNLQKIQKMQNRAARILTGSSYDVPTTDLMRQLKWQPLEDRRDNKKALLMHKVKNGTEPSTRARKTVRVHVPFRFWSGWNAVQIFL